MAFSVTRNHYFIWRAALNFSVDRSSAWNREPFCLGTEFIEFLNAADNFQMHLRNALPFSRHIELIDDLIADRLSFWRHPASGLATLGIPRDDGPNIAAARDPLSVVTAERSPTRRIRIGDFFR